MADAPDIMEVTVVDRMADAQSWGYARRGLPLRTVRIKRACPACGGPRGEPRLNRYCDDGEFYWVHNWTNPCGHVDRYGAVLREGGAYTGAEVVTNVWSGQQGRRQMEVG